MAVRRGFNAGMAAPDREFDTGNDDYSDGYEGGGFNLDNLFGMAGQSPIVGGDQMDGQLPDGGMPEKLGMDSLPDARPMQESSDQGNMERARDFMPNARPGQYTGGLPEGVTVPEDQFNGVPPSSNAMQTPLSPMSPSPVAMRGQPASFAPNENGGSGPQRPTFTASQSALFGSAPSNQGMFGSLGGLMEGGMGVVGDDGGGPTPTQMMLALARQLRGGQSPV